VKRPRAAGLLDLGSPPSTESVFVRWKSHSETLSLAVEYL